MRWCCWGSKCDCSSVETWFLFHTFEHFFDRAHQSVLHLKNQCHKGRYWYCNKSSTFGMSLKRTPWNFETSLSSLLLGKRLKIFEASHFSSLLPCKCRANALNNQRLSLYGCIVFLSKVKQFKLQFLGTGSGKTASLQPMGTSCSNETKSV